METSMPHNIGKPIRKVRYYGDLSRVRDKKWGSHCPLCKKGFLPVRRHDRTLVLDEVDFCLFCGQAFQYTDIKEMRSKDWAGDGRRAGQ